MSNNQTLIKTGIGVMGYSHLYEAYAFKAKKDDKTDDKTDDKKNANKPKFDAKIIFDKTRDADTIKSIKAAQNQLIENLKNAKKWSSQKGTTFAFKDCDEAEITLPDGTVTTMAEHDPKLKNKWQLSAKSPASRRVPVFYIGDDKRVHELPSPILDPDDNDEQQVAKSDAVAQLWAQQVYAGQYAVFTVTLRSYNDSPTMQGVTARLDIVTIVGGGTPANMVRFNDVFTSQDIADLVAWRDEHVKTLDPVGAAASTGEASVDGDTGEIHEQAAKTRKRRKPVVEMVDDVEDDVEDVDPDDELDAF